MILEMDNLNNFISYGIDGYVFKNVFGTKVGFKSKIGNERILDEYNNVLKLIERGVKIQGVENATLYTLTEDEKNEFLQFISKTGFERRSIDSLRSRQFYRLEIPFVTGKNLYHVLDKYRTKPFRYGRTNHDHDESKPSIPIEKFIVIFNAIKVLYDEVLIMNSIGIYHNDITEGNIILNEQNKLVLIDFTRVTDYKVEQNNCDEKDNSYYPDDEHSYELFEKCIYFGFENPSIRDKLTELGYNLGDEITDKLINDIIESFKQI